MSEKVINEQNLLENIKLLKEKSGCKKFCAVVKADAYGHGIENIVPVIENKVDYFAVATFDEGLKVKSLEKTKPVLVLSPELQPRIKRGIELTVCSENDIIKLEKQKKKVFVHLKLNTGMNRFGASISEAKNILKLIKSCQFVKLKGVFTHFHFAENKRILKKQKQNFNQMISALNLPKNIIIHAQNTAGALAGAGFEMCRCGIGLYGFGNKNLKPVLEITSKIVSINQIKKGDFVGYSAGFIAKKQMKIGVVKIGYADGFLRQYKFGSVFVDGKKCKIIGNICMDCMFIDLTKAKNVKLGDEAMVIWSGNSVKKISEKTNKIPYEILCGFGVLR